jgi:hypothetical protein
MTGAENSLHKKIGQNVNHVTGLHCVAHRLNMSVLNSVKNGKYTEDYDSILKRLHKLYQYSPKTMGQIKQVAKSLHCSIKKF